MTPERQDQEIPFDSLYRHGFVRVGVGVPVVGVVDPEANLDATLELARRADRAGTVVVAFPELGLSSYAAEDLFQQEALLDSVRLQLARLVEASAELRCALIVGAPLRVGSRLFNCAVVVHDGRPVGVVPKTYLPAYREFYEKRQFAAARDAAVDEITICGRQVPFGADLLFVADRIENLVVHVELCEDLWVPVPPSSEAALAGATVLVNLSASNALVAKADYRRLLCASQSARCISAHLYSAAGPGESTTDMAWDGHALIHENGERLAEAERFAPDGQLLTADIDLERLSADRLRMTSFTDAATDHRGRERPWRRVRLDLRMPVGRVGLNRVVARFPYVPGDRRQRHDRCRDVHRIQVQGLARRLSAAGIDKAVVGVSGGLDSTLAVAVAAKAMDHLGLPRTNVFGTTMPGFATSARTLANARRLTTTLGATLVEIDIRPAARQMLADLGHPASLGEPQFDVTYENVQAGERTSLLFRLANQHRALVVGTGDLSELAVGWCTYGVGDQMAHYDVNASVPKTLVRYLITWMADTDQLGADADRILRDILATDISPELVPAATQDTGSMAEEPFQSSESVVGPFELIDFYLYYLLRYGYRPSRIAYLAHEAWADAARGTWPEPATSDDRRSYDLESIKGWLAVFLRRFIGNQFKRSALPNAPKVGSGGSLSPRGDWRAPSDASSRVWLEELERNVP